MGQIPAGGLDVTLQEGPGSLLFVWSDLSSGLSPKLTCPDWLAFHGFHGDRHAWELSPIIMETYTFVWAKKLTILIIPVWKAGGN